MKFPPDKQAPIWRVAEFISSSDPAQHVLMLAVGDDIQSWSLRPDFVRWHSPDPTLPQHVLIHGGPGDGFDFIGPFECEEDATAYAENHRLAEAWWIKELETP